MRSRVLLLTVFFLAFVLRFYQLGSNPPSLYWDEASLGYNAFSIATTLHDEHGEFLPLTRFIAFGDYKPPGYIYAAAASIKLFGLSELTTRLPSALAGTLLVLVTYFLVKELFGDKRVGLLASLLVAISPWSLQLSRGAFEANLATVFSTTGIYLFLRAASSKRSIFFLLSSIFFAASMYTFNSHRVFVPLLAGTLFIIFARDLFKNWKGVVVFSLSAFILVLPLLLYMRTREAQLRFNEVSWVNDLAPIELSNKRITEDNGSIVGKIVHNRRVVYSLTFIKHYLDTFNSDWLFFKGDANFRLSIQTVGELYLIELPFLLAGIFFLVKYRTKASAVLFCWALLAPIPAAFARETPHALRTLNVLPVPQIIIAVGLSQLLRWRRLVAILYFSFLIFYLRSYYFDYPKKFDLSWQYGYKQAVEYVAANQAKYDQVNITNYYGRPYIYFLLFNQYPAQKYWQTVIKDRDWYGFWYIHGFGKYVFDDSVLLTGKILYVREPQRPPSNAKLVKTIFDLDSKPVFEIWE